MSAQELLDVAAMLHVEAQNQYRLHLDGMPGMTRGEIAEWLTDIEGRIRQQAAACTTPVPVDVANDPRDVGGALTENLAEWDADWVPWTCPRCGTDHQDQDRTQCDDCGWMESDR